MNNRWFLVFCVVSVLNAKAADFNILDYGAKSDTTQLSTSALQQAIDDCSQAGGGRVVVPAGQYKIGTVVLKSHVHLYLEQGATLYGSTNLDDYLPMKSDFVSLRTHTTTIQLCRQGESCRHQRPRNHRWQGACFQETFVER